MKNNNSLTFFASMAQNNPSEKSVKITANSDFSERDSNFILKFADSDSEILDLASGTGLIVNKISQHVKHINAVKAFS